MNEMVKRMRDRASDTDTERESEKRSLKRKENCIERDYVIDAGVIVLSPQHSNWINIRNALVPITFRLLFRAQTHAHQLPLDRTSILTFDTFYIFIVAHRLLHFFASFFFLIFFSSLSACFCNNVANEQILLRFFFLVLCFFFFFISISKRLFVTITFIHWQDHPKQMSAYTIHSLNKIVLV